MEVFVEYSSADADSVANGAFQWSPRGLRQHKRYMS